MKESTLQLIKQVIQKNMHLLEEEKLEELYKEVGFVYTPELTEFLISCGVNPLKYVSRIPGYYSYSNADIQEVVIPDNVVSIDEHAFSNCRSLRKIDLPSVLRIESSAFSNCAALRDVTLGNKLQLIGKYAFCNDTDLEKISIPESVTQLEPHAFANTSIERIVIPDSVNTLPSSLFENCSKLKEVVFGKGVTLIKSYAFSNCRSLKELVIPDTVTTIDQNAFERCFNLKKITLSSKLKIIGSRAFYSCTSLQDLTFNGTRDQWYRMDIGQQAYLGSQISAVHCSDGYLYL